MIEVKLGAEFPRCLCMFGLIHLIFLERFINIPTLVSEDIMMLKLQRGEKCGPLLDYKEGEYILALWRDSSRSRMVSVMENVGRLDHHLVMT